MIKAKKVNEKTKDIVKVTKKNVPTGPFQIGEKVVYPAHGLGEIVALENLDIKDKKFLAYKIYFTKYNLYALIPESRWREEGLRKLCSKEIINKVFDILSKISKANRSAWNKRMHEYEMKMYSGSILLVAEMVRSLFGGVGDPNRSYGERIIYENAFYRVSSEISAVLKMDIAQVEEKMISILLDTKQRAEKNQKLSDLQKSIDGDFSDEDIIA